MKIHLFLCTNTYTPSLKKHRNEQASFKPTADDNITQSTTDIAITAVMRQQRYRRDKRHTGKQEHKSRRDKICPSHTDAGTRQRGYLHHAHHHNKQQGEYHIQYFAQRRTQTLPLFKVKAAASLVTLGRLS